MTKFNLMRGRFAPSPTGEMHLGNIWTALLAWLEVRAAGGHMVLRMEDLDPDRSRSCYADGIIEDLKWLGLDWDEGPDIGGPYKPYCQDERRELYQLALERLEAAGFIYPCYCTRAELAASAPHAGEGERIYPGTCRSGPKAGREGRNPSLRLMVPSEAVEFIDRIKGKVIRNVGEQSGDFVVRRSDGVHAYQLAVVVDDAAMHISHVLRGDDLLDSTPKQLLLYRLLGLKAPSFAHVPLLLGEDGHRLSKRHGDLSVGSLRRRGAQPASLIGYLAWQAGLIDRYRPISAMELKDCFNIKRLPLNPVVVRQNIFSILDLKQ